MENGTPGKPKRPRRDGRPGSGLLIRPHVGAETRVKSGGRAERDSEPDHAALSDASDVAKGEQTSNVPQGHKR
jgi:hypothetical protein